MEVSTRMYVSRIRNKPTGWSYKGNPRNLVSPVPPTTRRTYNMTHTPLPRPTSRPKFPRHVTHTRTPFASQRLKKNRPSCARKYKYTYIHLPTYVAPQARTNLRRRVSCPRLFRTLVAHARTHTHPSSVSLSLSYALMRIRRASSPLPGDCVLSLSERRESRCPRRREAPPPERHLQGVNEPTKWRPWKQPKRRLALLALSLTLPVRAREPAKGEGTCIVSVVVCERERPSFPFALFLFAAGKRGTSAGPG